LFGKKSSLRSHSIRRDFCLIIFNLLLAVKVSVDKLRFGCA
jgi:hypothetical protein